MHSTGHRFPWSGPWKTLDPTLQIHRKQKSVRALTIPRVVIMLGPTERSLQGLSGCVVVSPSAMMWRGPGVFSEATVETPLSQTFSWQPALSQPIV